MMDDGKELDELPNDGVLTTNLPIKTPPGRYVATFITGSDVFFEVTHVKFGSIQRQYRLSILSQKILAINLL